MPRLSATPAGDARSLALLEWNETTSQMGLAATLVSALIHLVLFLLNRRRRDDGWYAVEAFGGAFYPALGLNLLQPVFGTLETVVAPNIDRDASAAGGLGGELNEPQHGRVQRIIEMGDLFVAAVGVSLAGVAGVHMMHAYLGLGRPHRGWVIAWFAHVALAIVCHDPFLSSRWVASTGGLFLAVAAGYQVVVYLRAHASSGTPGALVLALGWVAMAGVDIATWMGFGALFEGWRGAGFGIFMIALAQSLNLSRAHIRALADADDLNEQLRARVAELEAANREVAGLNTEIRHQLGVRSQDLADALARATDQTRSLKPGEVVNERYRIEAVLGSGGMGVVYRATRLSDDRPCAIKVIKHRPSPEHLARLSREAMVLSSIDHPNIIGIHDINVSDSGKLFLVMELAEGEPLDRRAQRYGDLAWALPLLRQTAEGLTAIHARQVVHRDLKPSNILLVEGEGEGEAGREWVKVVDFGIAGLLASDTEAMLNLMTTIDALQPTPAPARLTLTQTGAILGTPLFMAPELVSGTKEVGPAADIFSFGVVAYQVLGRELPFRELPLAAAMHGRRLEVQRPLSELCPALSASLAEVLTRCLCSEPSERPTASELVDALRASEDSLSARQA